MANIVPLDRTRSLRISAAISAPRDPFDVVVFLNHFMESDQYPDAILSQITRKTEPEIIPLNPTARLGHQRLEMTLGPQRVAFSLGRG